MFSGFSRPGQLGGPLGAGPAGGREPLLLPNRPTTPSIPGPPPPHPPTPSRVDRYIETAAALSETTAPRCAAFIRAAQPLISAGVHVLILVLTGYAKLCRQVYQIYYTLPVNELEMVIGLLLCFFGGTYVCLIAAFEAFRTMGGQAVWDHLSYINEQLQLVYQASLKDDLVDANRDGILDVDQMSPHELTQRKLHLAMVCIADPSKLQLAVGALWGAWLAVFATLKLQFAQTAAIAVAIAEMVKFPVVRLTAPLVTWSLGKDLTHWADAIIDSSLKVVCILLVWYMEKVRAAFYSGIRGGKMFGAAAIAFAQGRGWTDRLPSSLVAKPFNPEESYLDEVVGYTLAAIGFYWQVSHLFFLPFPLDWLLWPVSLAEYALEVHVSW